MYYLLNNCCWVRWIHTPDCGYLNSELRYTNK